MRCAPTLDEMCSYIRMEDEFFCICINVQLIMFLLANFDFSNCNFLNFKKADVFKGSSFLMCQLLKALIKDVQMIWNKMQLKLENLFTKTFHFNNFMGHVSQLHRFKHVYVLIYEM